MSNFKYSTPSATVSTAGSDHRNPNNRLKPPGTSDYEYLGRLVTRERPILRKSSSIQQNLSFPQNKYKYHHSKRSHRRDLYEQISARSSDDDSDGLSRPLGVIKINDRHLREIYRLPTPPPKVKRVYHRLRSPEPKVIERVFVRRPPPQIIENVIEVPPEKIRIINREKYLDKPTPITRSKLVHLKSKQQHIEEQVPSEQSSQRQVCIAPEQTPQQTITATSAPAPVLQPPGTSLVYPPQSNLRTVGYFESTVPPHIMLNSKQPLQLSPQQIFTDPTGLTSLPQQSVNQQMTQPTTSHPYPTQLTTPHQMTQLTPYSYPYQQVNPYQMAQATPYPYPQQQTLPNSLYGYTHF